MPQAGPREPRSSTHRTQSVGELLAGVALGLLSAAVAARFLPGTPVWVWALAVTIAACLMLIVSSVGGRRAEPPDFRAYLPRLTRRVTALAQDPGTPLEEPELPEFTELLEALEMLRRKLASAGRPRPEEARLTRSGVYEAAIPLVDPGTADLTSSGDFGTLDMVNRLDPADLRWLESSKAEQQFLGWPITELRQKRFLDIVHPDDRNLAWEQLQAALIKGEAHGLVYRIKTAGGESKAIEMNVGVRYASDMTVTHLRCHVTDVTAKVRAGRELRRRTRELTLVNQQLRQTNRELQELKDRYSDLYQNAPVMYFSLDEGGYLLECNNTMLRTLGYRRNELIGRPYSILLPESRKPFFATYFAEFLKTGYVEVESRWNKANGELIDVWLTATAVVGPDGKLRHSRSVAQDVTARRALEAELKEKNERLARANVELSSKNKELDEFTYVVSHDLQEPLRTLIAFSDFLVKDCGDQIDAQGKEHVQHLVDASRRMRALISDLLTLSRAGRVTAEFGPVNLGEVIDLVKADLAELIRSKAAEIRVAEPLPKLWGDRDRIVQLFGNLVANGLKYNQQVEPLVEIGAMPGDSASWATLFVHDNGIGIDREFHSKIFQIFRRLHPREQYEGTGAGLAICQKIVQAHNGQIWVESEAGLGATFYVKLPRQPVETPRLRTEALNAP